MQLHSTSIVPPQHPRTRVGSLATGTCTWSTFHTADLASNASLCSPSTTPSTIPMSPPLVSPPFPSSHRHASCRRGSLGVNVQGCAWIWTSHCSSVCHLEACLAAENKTSTGTDTQTGTTSDGPDIGPHRFNVPSHSPPNAASGNKVNRTPNCSDKRESMGCRTVGPQNPLEDPLWTN